MKLRHLPPGGRLRARDAGHHAVQPCLLRGLPEAGAAPCRAVPHVQGQRERSLWLAGGVRLLRQQAAGDGGAAAGNTWRRRGGEGDVLCAVQ